MRPDTEGRTDTATTLPFSNGSNAAVSGPAFMAEILMHKCDRHTALPNRRCNAFDRAEPDVAASEYTRHAGLEEVRVAAVHPMPGFRYVIAGQYISAVIARNLGR